jgi:Tfp pilus assembly protein PilF
MSDELTRDQAADAFRRAYQAQMAGRLDRAAELYAESIRLHPTAEAHTFLGWTYSFLGRYDDAIAECRRAIEVDPEFGNPYNDIGAYLIETGRPDEAEEWLLKALVAPRYEPRHYAHYNLARVYVHQCRYDGAVEHLEKALELAPGYTMAVRELGRLRARLN